MRAGPGDALADRGLAAAAHAHHDHGGGRHGRHAASRGAATEIEQLHVGGAVLGADPGRDHDPVQLGDEAGERHRRAQRHGVALHGLEVLEHVVDAAGRRVVEGRHLGHELLQDAGIGATAGECRGDLARVDLAVERQAGRLGDREEIAGAQHLVDQLRGLPGAVAAHMGDVGGELAQHRPRALDRRRGAAQHEGEPALAGGRSAPRQRGVDPGHAGLGLEPRGHDGGRLRIDARHVDQQLARRRPRRRCLRGRTQRARRSRPCSG